MVRVAVDAMGGDNAPGEIVRGVVDALIADTDKKLSVILVGREADVKRELEACKTEKNRSTFDESRIRIVHADDVIETGDPPVVAIRNKKESSMVKALTMVKEGEAEAFVSSGSTGAVLVGGQLIVGRLKGVQRTPLAPIIPTLNGAALLIDCGANVDAKPENLIQYAHMGTVYMKYIMGVENPRVGILNIGVEEEKGNALVKATYPLLKEEKGINFIGSVEAQGLVEGAADVIVTDAFAGNVALKMYEATGKALLKLMKDGFKSNVGSKLGAALALPSLKGKLKKFDASQYGGAPMLGLKGLVVKSHGSAKAKEIRNTLMQCIDFSEQNIPEKISGAIS
ncbi:MAG: phosphate acyltransferase PlsX [Lachnospiraceae bacterium]|nr:phosphate acyltransferase PlsX [Lachnospiraceae bacterium]